MKLLVATGNAGKLVEFREILEPLLRSGEHVLVSLADLGIEPPEETGTTFHENAALKAAECAKPSGLWTLGDDSGLCIDALDGAPGLYSARYAPTEQERRAKVLGKLAGVPDGRRGAHFFCALALASPDGKRLFRTEGVVPGRIGYSERGTNGFGYDPIFEPDETPGKTIAELPSEQKNRLSHRGRAIERLLPLVERLLRDGDLPAP